MATLDEVRDPRQREPLDLLVEEEEEARENGEPYPLYTVGGGILWTREVVQYDPARDVECPRCGRTVPDSGALCLVCSATRLVPIQRPMQPRRKSGRRRYSPGSLKGGKS